MFMCVFSDHIRCSFYAILQPLKSLKVTGLLSFRHRASASPTHLLSVAPLQEDEMNFHYAGHPCHASLFF